MSRIDKLTEESKTLLLGLYSLASSFSIAIINISLGLSLILTIFDRIRKSDFTAYNSKLLFFYSIFSLGVLFSFFDSINLKRSFDYIDIIIYPFLIIFIISYNKFSIKKIKYITVLINISILLNILYAFFQYYRGGLKRIKGNIFVMEFATLAGFISIFLIVYLINSNLDLKYKFSFSVLSLFTILSIIFSGTRGIWVAFPITIFLLLFLINKKYIIYFLVFIIFINSSIFLFLPDYYSERLISIFDLTNDRSNVTRILLWKSSLLIFYNNLINGVGLNNFSVEINKDKYFNQSMVSTAHAHNNFLQLASETGLIGLFSFLFLLYNVINFLIKFIKKEKNKNYQSFYISVLGVFILYNLQGLTEYNLEDKYTTFIMWILVSLTLIFHKRIGE